MEKTQEWVNSKPYLQERQKAETDKQKLLDFCGAVVVKNQDLESDNRFFFTALCYILIGFVLTVSVLSAVIIDLL